MVALVILWSYTYQLVIWPTLWWFVAIVNVYGLTLPLPPIIPWEQLTAGTMTLATIGGIQTMRERTPSQAEKSDA